MKNWRLGVATSCVALGLLTAVQSEACTGIQVRAEDGSVIYGRTLEWGSFDLNSRVAVVPRHHKFTASTTDGGKGFSWEGRYGFVAIDAVEKDIFADGMNETGLTAGVFYHPGYAEYASWNARLSDISISANDLVAFILSQYRSIGEVRKGVENLRWVPVVNSTFGEAIPLHAIITEPDGDALVIEFKGGKPVFFDNPTGVITNAPTFDWHITNLRNYTNLSSVALPKVQVSSIDLSPLGGGSGMIGLPGDFTPPSRFVRAVAFSQSARKTSDGADAVNETFRILDNFNVPVGGSEGANSDQDLKSATLWTTAWDTKNKKLYYHTQNNRRLRSIDLKKIDFGAISNRIIHHKLDDTTSQDIKDLTPNTRKR